MRPSPKDIFHMRRCLALAEKGRGLVSPNPMVGAVIVKDGKKIAEGYHARFGGAHAEIEALKKISFQAHGATLYCNLEPCFHTGRTPPCVHAVIKSGISKVVIAHKDPNPLVSGQSIKLLQKNGIKVVTGVLEKEARELNKVFLHWVVAKKSYIILKAGLSADHKIALRSSKKRTLITNKLSQKEVHKIRASVDAILVGVGTVLVDDPLLNVRGVKTKKQPLRIILDSSLKTPFASRIFSSVGGKVILVTTTLSSQKIKKYKALGADVWVLPSLKNGFIHTEILLKKLGENRVASLLVEGGAKVFESFLPLCNEAVFFVSSKKLGPDGLSWVRPSSLSRSILKKAKPVKTLGNNEMMKYVK